MRGWKTEDDIYRELRRFISDIRADGHMFSTLALQRLFAPDEAEVEVHLGDRWEPSSEIAKRCGMAVPRTKEILDGMAEKGLILRSTDNPAGEPMYRLSRRFE